MKRDHMPYNFVVHERKDNKKSAQQKNSAEDFSCFVPKSIMKKKIEKSQKRVDEILERLRKM